MIVLEWMPANKSLIDTYSDNHSLRVDGTNNHLGYSRQLKLSKISRTTASESFSDLRSFDVENIMHCAKYRRFSFEQRRKY